MHESHRKTLKTRREILSLGLGAAFLLPFLRSALADDPIAQVLRGAGKSTEWSDGFDSAGSGVADVRTTVPILSADIVNAATQAIALYSDIVARGGWPVVPTQKRLKIGMRGPAIVALRQRLMITGDLSQAARRTPTSSIPTSIPPSAASRRATEFRSTAPSAIRRSRR